MNGVKSKLRAFGVNKTKPYFFDVNSKQPSFGFNKFKLASFDEILNHLPVMFFQRVLLKVMPKD